MTTPSRYYSDTAVIDLLAVPGGGSMSTGATQFYAASGAPVGYPQQYPFTVCLEPGTSNFELVNVTAGAGTSASPWVCTRGYDGTTAKTHAAGTAIQHQLSAGDLATSRLHEAAQQAQSPHGLPAAAWTAGVFAVINETRLANSTTSQVTWSSIPQTYKHLLVICQARAVETAAQSDDITATINGDTGSVYSYLTKYVSNGGGSMVDSWGSGFAGSSFPIFRIAASQAGQPVNAGGGFALFPNYSDSAFNKMLLSLSGAGNGTNSFVDMRERVGFYNPASQGPITQLSLSAPGGSNYLTGSSFCLYGLG